jgi:hypothetical protein
LPSARSATQTAQNSAATAANSTNKMAFAGDTLDGFLGHAA